MNERYKKLWFDAASLNFGDSWEEQTAFMAKFAELIVRECAGVELYWLGEQDSKSVAEKIKQHFGVEE